MIQDSPDDPPFYQPAFEEAFRFIIDDYVIAPRQLAIFLPCAIRKPYSCSPSHSLFSQVINSVFSEHEYHTVVFGTCGVVPAELELMYPFAHYQYMLGKCQDSRIRQDFLEIETERISLFLQKTCKCYRARVAYCIGLFREAFERACIRSGIYPDLLLPTRPTIWRQYNKDCPFPERSLSMPEYLEEFRHGLIDVKEIIAGPQASPGKVTTSGPCPGATEPLNMTVGT